MKLLPFWLFLHDMTWQFQQNEKILLAANLIRKRDVNVA